MPAVPTPGLAGAGADVPRVQALAAQTAGSLGLLGAVLAVSDRRPSGSAQRGEDTTVLPRVRASHPARIWILPAMQAEDESVMTSLPHPEANHALDGSVPGSLSGRSRSAEGSGELMPCGTRPHPGSSPGHGKKVDIGATACDGDNRGESEP